jgi:hypothetical protein
MSESGCLITTFLKSQRRLPLSLQTVKTRKNFTRCRRAISTSKCWVRDELSGLPFLVQKMVSKDIERKTYVVSHIHPFDIFLLEKVPSHYIILSLIVSSLFIFVDSRLKIITQIRLPASMKLTLGWKSTIFQLILKTPNSSEKNARL